MARIRRSLRNFQATPAVSFSPSSVSSNVTEEEFRSAFDAHKDAVYRFLWRMAGPDSAEDLTQDVFLALLRDPDRYDPSRGTLRTFLLAIARNLALKRWRDAHRWTELDEEALAAEPFDIAGRETADIIASAVRSLPPLQREVVVLAEYEQLSLEEIAATVQSEVGTVKSRLHRGRQNLRGMLAPLRTGTGGEKWKAGSGKAGRA
jgi:RNA polymerase sigma-70 factor (ECF subfamily)